MTLLSYMNIITFKKENELINYLSSNRSNIDITETNKSYIFNISNPGYYILNVNPDGSINLGEV